MGFTTIVMVVVIVWAVSKISEDIGLSERINRKARRRNDD